MLPGGLRVVTETCRPCGRQRSASGSASAPGTRTPAHAGATHYLEHLLFKGTGRRTALEISAAIDAVGGEMNAFTGKEYTCYYARVLDADLPLAVDVISDMVTSSLIEPKDVEAERGVILEEIAMNDDDPADIVHEAFAAQLFGDTPLGRPILGTADSINSIAARADRRPLPRQVHAAEPGGGRRGQRATTTRSSQLVREAFGDAAASPAAAPDPRARRPGAALPGGCGPRRAAGVAAASSRRTWCSACDGAVPATTTAGSRSACSTPPSAAACPPGCSRRSGRSAGWPTRSTASPRSTPTPACGACTWAACPPRPTRCSRICRDELAKVVADGLTDAELDRGKGQLRGVDGAGPGGPGVADDAGSARPSWSTARLEPVDEVLAAIDAVTHDDVRRGRRRDPGPPNALAVVGPYRRRRQLRGGARPDTAAAGRDREADMADMIKVGVLRRQGAHGHAGMRGGGRGAGSGRWSPASTWDDDREALAGGDVVVDFTHPGAVMDNLRWCVGHGPGHRRRHLRFRRRAAGAGGAAGWPPRPARGVLIVPELLRSARC